MNCFLGLVLKEWRNQPQDSEILTPFSRLSPLPNLQLLSKHIPERRLDLELTWSFSGLSEMSLRLVEVRFR